MTIVSVTQPSQIDAQSAGLVSVIIPNYNHAGFVADAIQSVLAQSYHNYEIIVVDDGSTDNSREVIAGFGNHVHMICQQNSGLSAARNTGIRAARGVYVALLDADDMYEPHFLTTMVAMMEAQPDAAAVYCGYRFVDQVNRPLPQIEARLMPSEQVYAALLDANFLVPESMFVRRSCYDAVGEFDEALRACEDWDMWLRIARQYKVVGTDAVLTRHRILDASMSSDPTRMHRNRMAVIDKHFAQNHPGTVKQVTTLLRTRGQGYLTSTVEYLQFGDQDRAYDCLRRLATTWPDLLISLNTFYELACGNQPKGYRGDFASLNLAYNGAILFDMLDRLFNGSTDEAGLAPYRAQAYAMAYRALGLLSYGASDLPAARKYLLRAVASEPRQALDGQVISLLVKSMLPASNLAKLRQLRRRLSTSPTCH